MRSDRCGSALFRHGYTCIVAECKCVIANTKHSYYNEDQQSVLFEESVSCSYINILLATLNETRQRENSSSSLLVQVKENVKERI